MKAALLTPQHGYYHRESKGIFGTSGDFITSPDISQLFAEVILPLFIADDWNLDYSTMGNKRPAKSNINCGIRAWAGHANVGPSQSLLILSELK